MSKRITISDLAKELNLSKTLVSMVLNGKGDQYNINTNTQERVRELAKKLNYRPNQNARSLRTGKSNSIGFIIPDISNAFFSKIARALETELEKFDKRLLICSSDEDPDREKALVDFLISRNTDGLIVASCLKESSFYTTTISNGFPVVLIDRKFDDPNTIPFVIVGNYKGAVDAVEEIISSGKKEIYMLTLTPEYISPLKQRRDGFKDALLKNNIEFEPGRIIEVSHHNTNQEVEEKVSQLMDQKKVDGFFVSNNLLTLDLLKFLRCRDISIPSDVAVISFDDIPLFELTSPGITAVSQPVDRIASEVAAIIAEGKEETFTENGLNVVLPTNIVLRESI